MYPAKGRMNSFASGKKKMPNKIVVKNPILKESKNKAFLQSNHSETQ